MCNVVIHPVARWFGLIKTYCQRLFKILLGKWIKTTSNVASTEIFDSAFRRWIFCNIGRQWQCFISNHETRVKLSPLSCLLYMPRMPPSYVSVVDLLRKNVNSENFKKYFKLRIFFHSHIHLFDGLSCKQVGYIIDGMCNCSLILPFVSLAHQKYLITSHSLYFTDVLMYLRWAVINFTLKALLP